MVQICSAAAAAVADVLGDAVVAAHADEAAAVVAVVSGEAAVVGVWIASLVWPEAEAVEAHDGFVCAVA